MKKSWIIIGVVVLLALWAVSSYNGMVRANQAVDSQWAQVETQYQRRYDLIPNLVNTIKGNTKQEQAVFGEIADARTRYAGATNINDKVNAANALEGSLARLLVITENYPTLQSSKSFQDLMVELEGTENRVSVERKRFNDVVQTYNNKVQVFPGNMFAKLFGFGPRPYFQSVSGANQAPTVEF